LGIDRGRDAPFSSILTLTYDCDCILPHLTAMDAIDFDFDDDDDLSTALGTETLAVRDMVPEGFDNTPRARGLPECGGELLPGLLCANGVRYSILP
jgi:hypothetical protein